MNLRFCLLAGLTVLLVPTFASGQLPPRLKRCFPYPTLADEIQQMTEPADGESSPANDDEPETSIVVDWVTIDGGHSLSQAMRRRLIASARHLHWYSFDADRLNEFGEIGVRGALQNAGYFKTVVRVEGQILSSNPNSQHVAITIHVEEGPRFYLRSLKLRAADPDLKSLPFPYKLMRAKIPLHEGEIFDASKVRSGLESLGRLFNAHGYIDFTAAPETDIDDQPNLVDLTIRLDPQKQYRLRNIEIWGPDPVREKLLKSQWKVGEILDGAQLDSFFKKNKRLLPSDASEQDMQILRDAKYGTVELKFDFRDCSQIP
jgi:outer membrane protein assembly factor BamA